MDIRLEGVSLVVQGRPILDQITTTIRGNILTCLLGANGTGKTMLLRILCGELKPTSGRILMDGSNLSDLSQRMMSRHCAIVPQGVRDPPHLTVGELAELGRFRPSRKVWWTLGKGEREVVADCLRRCRVGNLVDRPIAQLSGGEKQRAWLAFALAQQKQFLLLDEALDALDWLARRDLFGLVAGVAKEGRGVLLITHDLGLATEFSGWVIVLDRGQVAYEGPPTGNLREIIRPVPES